MIARLTSDRARAVMLLILTVGASSAMLSYAQPFLAPVLFALVVGVVVSPVADWLSKFHIPRLVVAGGLLLLTSGLIVTAFIALEPLLTSLARRLPEIRAEIESWVQTVSGLLRGIEDLSNELERTVGGQDDEEAPQLPTVMDAIWLAPNLGAKVLIFAGTLFFFVLTRAELYDAAGRLRDDLYRADRAVARYFAAVTVVNTGLGLATAGVLSLIGLENALLWGAAAAFANYILYLGPLGIFFSLLVAGMMQFNGAMSFAPAFAFLLLNLTEAQFVTPTFVGQRLHIAPLAVFLAIVFGLWLWGPVGAIVALPVTLWFGVLLQSRMDERRSLIQGASPAS